MENNTSNNNNDSENNDSDIFSDTSSDTSDDELLKETLAKKRQKRQLPPPSDTSDTSSDSDDEEPLAKRRRNMRNSHNRKLQSQRPQQQQSTDIPICWSKTPFRTERASGREVIVKLIERDSEPMLISELIGIDDPQDKRYKSTRLNINQANQQVRKGVKDGKELAYMTTHEGCKQTEPHLICSSGSYLLPTYWISPFVATQLKHGNDIK